MVFIILKNKKFYTGVIFFIILLFIVGILYLSQNTNKDNDNDMIDIEINMLEENIENGVFGPGDIKRINYDIINNKKTTNINETIVLKVGTSLNTEIIPAEYEIYFSDDVELIEGKGHVPKNNATPLEVRNISNDGSYIIYNLPEYELEKGIKHRELILLFKGSSSNVFQDVSVSYEIIVEVGDFKTMKEIVVR